MNFKSGYVDFRSYIIYYSSYIDYIGYKIG